MSTPCVRTELRNPDREVLNLMLMPQHDAEHIMFNVGIMLNLNKASTLPPIAHLCCSDTSKIPSQGTLPANPLELPKE